MISCVLSILFPKIVPNYSNDVGMEMFWCCKCADSYNIYATIPCLILKSVWKWVMQNGHLFIRDQMELKSNSSMFVSDFTHRHTLCKVSNSLETRWNFFKMGKVHQFTFNHFQSLKLQCSNRFAAFVLLTVNETGKCDDMCVLMNRNRFANIFHYVWECNGKTKLKVWYAHTTHMKIVWKFGQPENE